MTWYAVICTDLEGIDYDYGSYDLAEAEWLVKINREAGCLDAHIVAMEE